MNQYLVDRQWLIQQLNNPQVAIVDCRFNLANPNWGEEQYSQSHIEGAYYLSLDRDLSSQVQRHGGRHLKNLPVWESLKMKKAKFKIIFRL